MTSLLGKPLIASIVLLMGTTLRFLAVGKGWVAKGAVNAVRKRFDWFCLVDIAVNK